MVDYQGMGDELPERIDAEWQRLVERLRWTFVADAEAFLAQVFAALHERHGIAHVTDMQIRVELQQQYNQRLYRAVLQGRLHPGDDAATQQAERACQEIWSIAWRLVRSKGFDEQIAEDVAQRVVTLLIEKPYDVRVPGSLSAWVMYKVLGLLAGLRDRPVDDSLEASHSERSAPVFQDRHDVVEAVEDKILAREVLADLPRLLSVFQLQLIQLVVLEEYSHRDVATMLGVRETRVRIEKARALQKIRNYLDRQMP